MTARTAGLHQLLSAQKDLSSERCGVEDYCFIVQGVELRTTGVIAQGVTLRTIVI